MGQLHKRLTDAQVRAMLQRYLKRELEGHSLRTIVDLGNTPFFKLLARYRATPTPCSVRYARRTPPNTRMFREYKGDILTGWPHVLIGVYVGSVAH